MSHVVSKHYGTGDHAPKAVKYAEDNLRSVVSNSLAAVLREKPDKPFTEIINKLKAHTLEHDGIEKPLTVKIDGLDVALRNKACKTEVMLPKHGLYGLHMPSVQNWQDILDFIRQDFPNTPELTLIIETQDPGADLVFVNDTPYYADLSQQRLIRKRKQLSSVGLNPGLLKMAKSIRGGHNSNPSAHAKPPTAVQLLEKAAESEIARGVEARRTSDFAIGESTLRPDTTPPTMASTRGPTPTPRGHTPNPPPLSGMKSLVDQPSSFGTITKSSRRLSRIHLAPEPPAPETVCSSVLGSIPNASPRTIFQVVELISRQWESLKATDGRPGEAKLHLVTAAQLAKSPLAIFDLIDSAIGVEDNATCPPVLVVSFRSRRIVWRRLLARVYATVSPNVEWGTLQRAKNVEAEKASERDELQSQRHLYYWRHVITARADRDAKRKEYVAHIKAIHEAEGGGNNETASMGSKKTSTVSGRSPISADSTVNNSNTLSTTTGRMIRKSVSNLSETATDLQDTTRSLLAGDFNQIMVTINKATAKRERRRQREDMQHCIIDKEERAKAAVKLQATFRGAKERFTRSRGMVLESTSAMCVTPGQDLGSTSVVSASFDQKFKHSAAEKIDAPAIIRRVFEKAAQSNPGLLTTSTPAPKAPAVRFQFWAHRKNHIRPQYEGDVSSDEEEFENKVVIVPPKSASQRRRHFNPLLRLAEINTVTGYDDYEWGKKVSVEFSGLSVLQRKVYEVYKNHALELLHVVFLEVHHRRAYSNGVNPNMSFSEYVKTFFPDIFSWFSLPHFLSQSTAPNLASALQYGSPTPLMDRLLYQSTSPSILPWGRQAPLQLSDDESAWFMPHWDENAPMKVLTTVDFTSAPVWKKQLDYLTLNGRPVWWFSMCPELGIYVNNQPFIAARRPETQCIEGFSSAEMIESVVQVPTPPALSKYPDPPRRNRTPERLQSSKTGLFQPSLRSPSAVSQSSRKPTFNDGNKTAYAALGGIGTMAESVLITCPTETNFPGGRNAPPLGSGPLSPNSFINPGQQRPTSASLIKSEYEASSVSGPRTICAPESLTLIYPEGSKIRLRAWFGVHWTEMERRLRLQVAQDAFNNAMNITCYVPESLIGDHELPSNSIGDDMSEMSVVRPIGDNPSFGDNATHYEPEEESTILDDTHVFKNAVSYTDACEAPLVQACCVSMIPPPKPIKILPRSNSPDPSLGKDGRSRSRSNSRGPETRARSMRRLRSLVSVRNPDSTNSSVTLNATGTSSGGKIRPSVSMMATQHNDDTLGTGGGMSMAHLLDAAPYSPPTMEDSLRRVRTAPALAEKLFSPSVTNCRYIRTPALDVSGYQWWCHVDQYLGHVHQGLREGANIAVAITHERQLFYSVSALLVAHANFADTDEIESIYELEQRRQHEITMQEKRKKEALRKANYDPDDRGNKNDWLLDPTDRDVDTSLSASGISWGEDDSAILSPLVPGSTGGGVGVGARSLSSVKAVLGVVSATVDGGRLEASGYINTFIQLCGKALNLDLTKTIAAFNAFISSIGNEYFLHAIEADIGRAERASTAKDVRQHIIAAVQRTERYCSLLLVYLFLRSQPKSTELELNSIIPWLFGPKMEVAMEWLNDIDPWALTPARSPDPLHFIYSSIYSRWTETDGFVSRAM